MARAPEIVAIRKTKRAADKYAQFCRDNESLDWTYTVEKHPNGYAVIVRPTNTTN